MLIDVILAGVIVFLFYVVNQLCLAVMELRKRLDANGIYE